MRNIMSIPAAERGFWRKPGKAGKARRKEAEKISIFSSRFHSKRQKSTKCSKKKRRISCDNTKGNRKSGGTEYFRFLNRESGRFALERAEIHAAVWDGTLNFCGGMPIYN